MCRMNHKQSLRDVSTRVRIGEFGLYLSAIKPRPRGSRVAAFFSCCRLLIQSHATYQHCSPVDDLIGFAVRAPAQSDITREHTAITNPIPVGVTTVPIAPMSAPADLNPYLRSVECRAGCYVRCPGRRCENE